MAKDLTRALDNVEMTYQDVVAIANNMLSPLIEPIDTLVQEIRDNSSNMPVEAIRDYIIRLQLRCYELGEPRDKAAMKRDLSEALRKEKYSAALLEAEGTVNIKDTKATLASSDEIVVEALYELVASSLKTKLDGGFRLVDSLKSILMSRMQEAKFMNMGTTID